MVSACSASAPWSRCSLSLALIAAQSENRVIGDGTIIPWRVKGEQKLFKDITMGGVLVMGRKTYETIGKPLPGRETVIVTRNDDFTAKGCHVVHSLEEALATAGSLPGATFVAGGGEIYSLALPIADILHLTTIHLTVDGDVLFPEISEQQFELRTEQFYESNIDYTYRCFERIKPSANPAMRESSNEI